MRRTTINLTEATDRQIEYLEERGYGSFSKIVRLAIDRMYRAEYEAEGAEEVLVGKEAERYLATEAEATAVQTMADRDPL